MTSRTEPPSAQREEREPADRQPVRGLDDPRAIALVEAQAVRGRRRDEARSREHCGDQRHVVDVALEDRQPREPLAERHGQEEGEEDLDARQRDAQLLEELADLAVAPLVLALVLCDPYGPSCRSRECQPYVVPGDEREQRRVEPVERAAVGAEQRARVLRARVALDLATRRGRRAARRGPRPRRSRAPPSPPASPGRGPRTRRRGWRRARRRRAPRRSCWATPAAPAAASRTRARRGSAAVSPMKVPTSTSTTMPSPCSMSRSSTPCATASPIHRAPTSVTSMP